MNSKNCSLQEIVGRFGGELRGDAAVRVSQVATLEAAQPHHLSFLANGAYRKKLEETRAAAVIVGREAADATALPRIVCDNPYAYFARVSAFFNPPEAVRPGVHPSAAVHATAQIPVSASVGAFACLGENVRLGEGCVVGEGCCLGDNVTVGAASRLYPGVTIYHGCVLGSRVIVHSGAVVGADGFGFAQDEGRWLKIPQIGRVIVGDDVEIGANTTLDRGALDDTVIEEGVKLDNQIQVGHNVTIGAHTAVAGCVGIAGSARIGRHCRIGGAAVILGHLEISDHVIISAGTLVAKSISQAGQYTSAYPLAPHREWLKNAAHLRHLDDLTKKVRELEGTVRKLLQALQG